MLPICRVLAVLLAVGVLTTAALAQPDKPPAPKPEQPEVKEAFTLPVDPKKAKILEVATDYIQDKQWEEASRALQSLLDAGGDVFTTRKQKDADGKESTTLVSVRAEAARLLGSLPAEGRAVYEKLYKEETGLLLAKAKAGPDVPALAQLSRRFFYTEAGAEATQLLVGAALDRGDWLLAALAGERLPRRKPLRQWPADTLFKAAVAFRIAGDKDHAETTWQELNRRADGKGLTIGGRTLSIEEWEKELEKATVSAQASPGKGGTPFLEKEWSKEPFTGLSEFTRNDHPLSQAQIKNAVKTQESRGQPILPGFFPIAADGKLIYRSYWGIHAVDVKTGKMAWEVPSEGSLEKILNTSAQATQQVTNWIANYTNTGKGNVLYENSTVGTLSTDNSLVYAVEDLALAPITVLNQFGPWGGPFPQQPQPNLGAFTNHLYHNKLVAYDLKSGKLRWVLGGHDEKAGELKDTYFLGPPLPLHGKLYVLTEKNQELRLLCLDPNKTKGKCEVAWSQKLAEIRDKMADDPSRRMHAVHLAAAGGVLVCPTNAGVVFGVDALTGALLWVHAYREKGQFSPAEEDMIRMGLMPAAPGFQPRSPNAGEWKVTAPVIAGDKVVFTAPDGRAVTCLNLRDGALAWKANRSDDDLYLGGVVAGKVLIVSKKSCRALNLADGKQAWQLDTGIPSGQGAAGDGLYYLPLKVATRLKDKEPVPAVLIIDVAKGAVRSVVRSRKKEVPGNLLFTEGAVISQGVDEIAAFPQLAAKRAAIDRLLAANPKDPVGLSERADVHLDAGNWQGAVADLMAALAVLKDKPDADTERYARGKLFEALAEYLQRDFGKAEKYLDDYRRLCQIAVDPKAGAAERAKAEAETRNRLVSYFGLLARGRETQGRPVEAVRAYLGLAELGNPNVLVPAPFDPTLQVALPVFAAGRIKALLEKATPAQRRLIEEEIDRRWQDLRKEGSLDSLRTFVRLFGGSPVGQEARLTLAERLVKTRDFTGAELQLLQVSQAQDAPQQAGRAVEALALLNAERGLFPDALHYYRLLEKEFTNTVIRDGKTGADLFKEAATDKRFLPFLEEPKDPWKGKPFQGKTEKVESPRQRQIYTFEPAGEVLPFFQKHQVALDLQSHALKLSADGEEVWSQNLTRTMFQNFLWNGANPNNTTRYPYHTVGHVIVLPLAHLVFGLDPVKKQALWEKSLTGSTQTPQQWNNVITDPKDGTLTILYPDGYTQKLGQSGPIGAAAVCLQTRDGLLALDPADGRTLWLRSDVSSRAGLFGDGDTVYVVDVNADGQPTRTRAFRVQDGGSVDVPDFTRIYQERQRLFGRKILASATERGKLVVRIYDLKTGKDDWRKEFAANSTLLRSEAPNLAGVVEPDGSLTVVDLSNQKEVLRVSLDPKHLDKVQGVTLLQDRERFYVAINGLVDQNIMNWGGGIMPNLMPNFGYRMVRVNGPVYAFDRQTEKLVWRADVPNQMLLLNHFAELPVLLFTSRYTTNNGGRFMQEVAVRAIEKGVGKRGGKKVFDEKLNQNTQQFHEFKFDPQTGVIELTSWNLKVRLEPKKDQPK